MKPYLMKTLHATLPSARPILHVLPEVRILSDEEAAAAGLNDSMVHVDFMIGSADMIIEGLCEDGKIVPIFINGNWAN